MKALITRKTRLGFGWSTITKQVWNSSYTASWLAILEPTGPNYVGTIKTLRAKIASDANYQVSRNTCSVASCWFIRIRGTWKKIRGDFYLEVYFPLYKDYPRKSSVEVEVED